MAELWSGAAVMLRGAAISEDGQYRWTLTRQWGGGDRVCWIMLNPSTADAQRDDPTILSCIRRTDALGYRRLVVVNRLPIRTSHPAEAQAWSRTANLAIMESNAGVIESEMASAALVIAAWGNAGWLVGDTDFPTGLMCIGTNANGSPKHPLARGHHRVPEDAPLQAWPVCGREKP